MNLLTTRTFILMIILLSPAQAFSQNRSEGGTYFKVGILHSQGSIEKFDYQTTGISGEIENHFKKDHLWLSGWSFGYRKDKILDESNGHLINGKLFKNLFFRGLRLKPAIGIEYGLSSDHFDQTRFNEHPESYDYTHLSLIRDARVPTIPGSSGYGTRYAFIEVATWTNRGPLIMEMGMRLNVMRFGLDSYSISPSAEFHSSSEDFTRPVPYLFINLGLRIKK